MSSRSIWLRARNGAFYRDPVFIFQQGFICFDAEELPELVAWLEPGSDRPPCHIIEVTKCVLGRAANLDSFGLGNVSERVVQDTTPWQWRRAASFRFKLRGRIPIPGKHGGTERYARNCCGAGYDWPAHSLDASELTPGKP